MVVFGRFICRGGGIFVPLQCVSEETQQCDKGTESTALEGQKYGT